MQILRTLSALVVLVVAVAAWLMAAAPPADTSYLQATAMASASRAPPASVPATPPPNVHWRALDQRELARWRGPYWLRWDLPATTAPANARALRLSLRAASQPYWNGQPLPPNGTVGRNAGEERPGRIDSLRVLPAAAGPDTLVVLASSQHQWLRLRSADALIAVGPVASLYAHPLIPWLIAALATGALGAACLYLLAAQRGRPPVPGARVLLALGAVGLALPVLEGWRPLLGYPYPWHGPRLLALLLLHLSAAILLPAYLARRFGVAVPIGLRVTYLATLLCIAAFVPGFDGRGAALLLLSLLAAAALLLRARGEPDERWPILTLVSAGALAIPLLGGAFLDGPYFLFLAVLMGFLLVRHAAQLRTLDQHNALLREERARLSLQLLQRGIQPHWLMNTLTCLQELIEQAPMRASALVQSLAEQFDRLRQSSSQQYVALEDELALCRNHLDIVGMAIDQHIAFQVDVQQRGLQLPPGVLHAQVENALTHAGAAACAAQPFQLHVQREGLHWVLVLRSARGSAPHRGQGTGTRYIEASLAAACPDGWRFVQGPDGAHWCGRMELTCAS
ncbi:histidine kinase [Bacillus subtilis subsp. subtilis]|nr:histidine kinase [Bacillus subtilis subsp. subtilis]